MKNKLKKLFSYYKPYKGLFFADMFFAILGAAVTLVIPLIVRYITNEVVYFEKDKVMHTITILGGLMIFLVVVEYVCNYFIAFYGHMMGAKMEANMRSDIFGHYQKLTFAFYDNQKVGALLSRITSDLFDITELLHHGPEDIVISIIKLVGSFIILVNINVQLTIVAFIFVPFMIIFAGYYNRKMKVAFKRNRARIADINSQIEDSLSGIRVVKSFANEHIEMKKFEKGNDNFVAAKKISYSYMAGYHSTLTALTTLVTVVVLIVGARGLVSKTIVVADLVTFLLYINNFIEPVKKLINFTEMFQNGYSGFDRFLEMMSIAPDIKDEEDAVSVDRLEGSIEFNDVSFRYSDSDEDVLKNVNLDVKAGEYMALVGPSGVGKTTLCSLIPRFYEVTGGNIKIDGMDIRKIKLDDLRNNIGIVQQDVYLFAGTIMENIRYGNPDATDEDVIRAARRANAHEFIMSFPDGYDTLVGERGVTLSGGQKQRIAIARMLLRKAPIMVFDDSLSAVDSQTDYRIRCALKEHMREATVILISHRVTSLMGADEILVLNQGKIEERGTHGELIRRNGIYRRIYEIQMSRDDRDMMGQDEKDKKNKKDKMSKEDKKKEDKMDGGIINGSI